MALIGSHPLNQLTDALVYIRQPEYWEIEVVGSLRGTGLAGPAPYAESLEVTATIGGSGSTPLASWQAPSSGQQDGGPSSSRARACARQSSLGSMRYPSLMSGAFSRRVRLESTSELIDTPCSRS
jgi:hypothetical protein